MVIQAIPSYRMGIYKFPPWLFQKSIKQLLVFGGGAVIQIEKFIGRIEILCALWSVLVEWVSKDLSIFNDALLGRQAWRLVREPIRFLGVLWRQNIITIVLFLMPVLLAYGSYSWKSIWSSKALLKDGLLWHVGNGRSIHIWDDLGYLMMKAIPSHLLVMMWCTRYMI